MRNRLTENLTLIAILLAVAAWPAPARAFDAPAPGVKAGFLVCQESPGWGLVLGSSRDIACNYTPAPGVHEHYTGRINRVGADIGYISSGKLLWEVVAPTSDVRRGDLDGSYAGLTAGATVGIGANVNAMIGGFHESIVLQPISVEGNNGLDVAAGIMSMTLTVAPDVSAFEER